MSLLAKMLFAVAVLSLPAHAGTPPPCSLRDKGPITVRPEVVVRTAITFVTINDDFWTWNDGIIEYQRFLNRKRRRHAECTMIADRTIE